MFGIYSMTLNCFVRLVDISKSSVDPALQYCVLAFCEKEGAEKAVESIRFLNDNVDPYEIRRLPCVGCDD